MKFEDIKSFGFVSTFKKTEPKVKKQTCEATCRFER